MNFGYIYIDESSLGLYCSKYFTIAALVTKEPKVLEKIIKKLRQRKLRKF